MRRLIICIAIYLGLADVLFAQVINDPQRKAINAMTGLVNELATQVTRQTKQMAVCFAYADTVRSFDRERWKAFCSCKLEPNLMLEKQVCDQMTDLGNIQERFLLCFAQCKTDFTELMKSAKILEEVTSCSSKQFLTNKGLFNSKLLTFSESVKKMRILVNELIEANSWELHSSRYNQLKYEFKVLDTLQTLFVNTRRLEADSITAYIKQNESRLLILKRIAYNSHYIHFSKELQLFETSIFALQNAKLDYVNWRLQETRINKPNELLYLRVIECLNRAISNSNRWPYWSLEDHKLLRTLDNVYAAPISIYGN